MQVAFRILIATVVAILSGMLGGTVGFFCGRLVLSLADIYGPPGGVGLIVFVAIFGMIGAISGFVVAYRLRFRQSPKQRS